MKHIHKIELTEEKLHAIIRKHFDIDFADDLEVNLVDRHEQQPDAGWMVVPILWPNMYCPTEFPEGTRIDVMFRDGEIKESVTVYGWESNWRQNNVPWNIEKYRISKDSK